MTERIANAIAGRLSLRPPQRQGVELAKQHVSRLAVMHADEASHWDHLHDGWQVGRVNHSEAYSAAFAG